MEPTRIESVPVIDVTNADSCCSDAELELQVARRLYEDYEEAAPSAAAALFAGLFIGAGSTALMFCVAMLIF